MALVDPLEHRTGRLSYLHTLRQKPVVQLSQADHLVQLDMELSIFHRCQSIAKMAARHKVLNLTSIRILPHKYLGFLAA